MNSYIKETRAKRFNQLLEERGESFGAVCSNAGIDYGTLHKLKEGILGKLEVKTAKKIASYFTVDIPINVDWVRGLNAPKYERNWTKRLNATVDNKPAQLPLIDHIDQGIADATSINIMYKVLKVPMGCYKNVLLTQEELEALYNRFGKDTVDKALDLKSKLITEGKDRYTGWGSDFSALFNYLRLKEKEGNHESN